MAGWTSIPARLDRRADSIRLLLRPVAPALGLCDDRQYGPDELLRAAVDLVRFLVPDPAVLIFEDLHGADPESISLFGRLATVPDLDALLVGTYRPEDLGRRHALARLVADLERRRSITHISLARLSRGSVGDLLGAVYRLPGVVAGGRHRPPPHRRQPVLRRGAPDGGGRDRSGATGHACPCPGTCPRSSSATSTVSMIRSAG